MRRRSRRYQAEQIQQKRNLRYLAADKGIYLNFVLDSESAILFFKASGFQPLTRSLHSNVFCELARIYDTFCDDRGILVPFRDCTEGAVESVEISKRIDRPFPSGEERT